MPLGLYISVPFCRTKCSYCNFASDVFSKSAYENYVARVLEDIATSRQLASELGCALNETADSIYLGGGTPSILDAPQLLRIFAALRGQFAVTPDAEITVECAPGTLTPALIETLLQCGVNRVSLGVQSFVDREAQSVGRLHKRSTVLEEIARLREAGLGNINIDLIAGLPHQTAESWAFSVSETIATGVPHVSVYMLEVDEDSRLGRELIAGGARYHAHFVPDDDMTADFYHQACQMLASAGIAQYEISNFARVGLASQNSESRGDELQNNESRHNLKYWTRQPYVGFGVDAHSMLPLVWGRAPSPVRVGTAALGCPAERSSAVARTPSNAGSAIAVDRIEADHHQGVRFATPDSLDAYMNRASHTVTPVSAQAAIEESFFLGLRLNRGIDLESIRTEFSPEFSSESSSASLDCGKTHECVDHRGRAALQGRVSPAKSARASAPVAVLPRQIALFRSLFSRGESSYREGHDFSRATSAAEKAAALAAEASGPQQEFSRDAVTAWESAINQCVQEGLLEQQEATLRLTARGRFLSNEVFARFLIEETKVGTGHVNPR
jgi:oxygen-independent coproporphyrinogen III oxidase